MENADSKAVGPNKIKEWAPPPLRPYEPLIINVALTGAVPSKEQTPSLPVTPEEIVADAIACADVGASIVHVHLRDDQGRPTHDLHQYERVFGRIRDKRPDLIICGTTSARVASNPGERQAVLDLPPDIRPDMASLTLGSFNFPQSVSDNPPDAMRHLLARMLDQGVKPELEVFEAGMVNTAHVLIDKGLIPARPYFNIILGSLGSAPAFVRDLADIADRLPGDAVWAGGGTGAFQKPMTIASIVMGGHVRTGLEDAPRASNGEPATNEARVKAVLDAARLVGREIATPDQTRKTLEIPLRRS